MIRRPNKAAPILRSFYLFLVANYIYCHVTFRLVDLRNKCDEMVLSHDKTDMTTEY